MFKITIEADTPGELALNLQKMLDEFAGSAAEPAPRKPRGTKTQPKVEEHEAETETPSTDEVDKELLEEVPPAPNTAKQVVDAGTGKPAPASDAPIQMTFNDVKAAAAKLASKDTPKLKEIIEKHGGTKLSDVPKENLGDFATDVMEALG